MGYSFRVGELGVDTSGITLATTDRIIVERNGTMYEASIGDDFPAMSIASINGQAFPAADGTADQVLTTDGSATLAWDDRLMFKEVVITEAAGGAGQTYTASVSVPAGAWVLDVMVTATAVWDDTGACTGIVGDAADDNGYFTGINLKATDLLVGEYLRSADISGWGGKEGAYLTAAGLQTSYGSAARVISMIVTSANGDGTAGRTRFGVLYVVPSTSTAATQAAT